MPFIRFTQKCSNSYTGREQKICLLGSIKINAVNPCCKKRHEAIRKKEKERKKKKRKERKKKRKKNMRIKIDHVLTKIFQVPMKREIPFNKHSRITLATKYST